MPNEPADPRAPRALWWILAASTAVRLALLPLVGDMALRGDERAYVLAAHSIVASGVPDYGVPTWDSAHWAPLYPYSLAGVLALVGDTALLPAIRVLQVVLAAATVYLVFRVARRLFDQRTALLSALAWGFFPTGTAYTHYVLSETVFAFLMLLVAWTLVAGEGPGARRALAAGALGGLCVLTKSAFLLPAAAVVLVLLRRAGVDHGARLRAAGAFALGLALVVSPWTAANTLRFDRFLLVDTNAGNVLLKNWNSLRQENYDIGLEQRYARDRAQARAEGREVRRRVRSDHFVDAYDAEVRAAVRHVATHPLEYLRHSVLRAAELINPTSFLVRGLRKGDYGPVPPVLVEALIALTLAWTMGVLALGVVGIVVPAPTRERTYVLALLLALVALGVLVISQSRYRFPLMPLLTPFAVDAALHLREPGYRRAGRRWGLAGLLLLLMTWAWVSYLPYSY